MRALLHVGCGSKVNKPPREYGGWRETRLDYNRVVEPDVVSSIVAMPMVESGQFDAVFASHVLEHLYRHEVAMALAEFHRVLKPGGHVRLHVPDLQAIGGKIALDQLDYVVYSGGLGAVTPLDMLYGHAGSIGAGNLFMAHRTGFTAGTLTRLLDAAGFERAEADRSVPFELKVVAHKPEDAH